MVYTFIENVEQTRYEHFVSGHPKSHFMQSYAFGELKQAHGYRAHYVGMEQEGTLVATCLLLEKRLAKGMFTYFYAQRGMVLDYQNHALLEAFVNAIASYVKAHKGVFFKMDPDIALREIDDQGNEIVNEHNNYPLFNKLIDLGFHHHGFNKDFENAQPRFTFRLDLTQDKETIHKNLHATTRKILNRTPVCKVYKGSSEDLNQFVELMHETAHRAGFDSAQDAYYRDFYSILGKADMTDLYFASINLSELIGMTQEKIKTLSEEAQKAKSEGKKKDLLVQKEKLEKEIGHYETIAQQHTEVILTSIITVKYGNKSWTVHGGNNDLLRELNGNYYVYYQIIQDMKDQGFALIDFFGTTGNPDPKNPIYGIYLFKKRLGGTYLEFLGEFDLVFNKPLYWAYHTLAPALRKLLKRERG
ncbi:MAG: lipid II:glycine glycyltransferase FemX [Erysipelotrichaceae bacterium]